MIALISDSKLSNVKTELLIAMIFLILTVIGTGIFAVIFLIILIGAILSPYGTGAPLFFILIGFLGLLFFVPSIVVLIRVRAMLSAAQKGNI
ncbi:MAG: hypothetical protein ACYCSG_03780, partial [Thermoplasmataceae archaeon]